MIRRTVIHVVLGDGGQFNTSVILWNFDVERCVKLQ